MVSIAIKCLAIAIRDTVDRSIMSKNTRFVALLLLLGAAILGSGRSEIAQPEGADSLPLELVPGGADGGPGLLAEEGAEPEGESSMDLVGMVPPVAVGEEDAAEESPSVPEAAKRDALASLEEAQLYLQRARVIQTSQQCTTKLREGDGDLTWSVALLVESKYNESLAKLESAKRSLTQCTSALASAMASGDDRKPLNYLLQQSIVYIDEAQRQISPSAPSREAIPSPSEEGQSPQFQAAGARSSSCRLDGSVCQYSACGKGKKLPQCATGFASGVTGGARGVSYLVTNSDDSPSRPQPGSFRYGVELANKHDGGVWITFARSMTVALRDMVWIRSSTTVDGRGVNVIFTGRCFVLGGVSNVILHNFQISGVPQTDTVHIFGSSRGVWVDHVTSFDAKLGLVSVVQGSTDVTISNCYLSNRNFNMLLGASDADSQDRNMRVTVFRNWFKDSMQRMPHCRWGYCHVVNNYYTNWGYYAIGGRAHAQILSEGNVFLPGRRMEVTPWFPGATKGALDQTASILSKNDLYLGGSTFHQFHLYGKTSLEPKYTSIGHRPPVIAANRVPKLVQACSGALSGHKLQRCLYAA